MISEKAMHYKFMAEAMIEARNAFRKNEIPIGAVVVCDNKIIARGYNQTEILKDATAHAEMIVLTAASDRMGTKYLDQCTLYVTVEPCVMCAGACAHTHIGNIVFGAGDNKQGYSLFSQNILHPKTKVVSGIMGVEARKLMKEFFKKLRMK